MNVLYAIPGQVKSEWDPLVLAVIDHWLYNGIQRAEVPAWAVAERWPREQGH